MKVNWYVVNVPLLCKTRHKNRISINSPISYPTLHIYSKKKKKKEWQRQKSVPYKIPLM